MISCSRSTPPGFSRLNEVSGVVFPRTHFLWLASARLRDLMARYRVTADKYTRTPSRAAGVVGRLGIGDTNFPPEPLRFYDTLQLLIALGLAEGGTIGWLPVGEGGVTHFGAATRELAPT